MNFSGIVLISLIAPTKVESDLILWCGRIKSILQMASERKHFQSFVSTTPRLPVPNGSLGHIPTLVNTPRACICSVSPSWARKINNSSSCRTVPLLMLNSWFKLLRFLFLLNYTQQEVLVNELFPPIPSTISAEYWGLWDWRGMTQTTDFTHQKDTPLLWSTDPAKK